MGVKMSVGEINQAKLPFRVGIMLTTWAWQGICKGETALCARVSVIPWGLCEWGYRSKAGGVGKQQRQWPESVAWKVLCIQETEGRRTQQTDARSSMRWNHSSGQHLHWCLRTNIGPQKMALVPQTLCNIVHCFKPLSLLLKLLFSER